MAEKVKITKTILEQIEKVRASGKTNMVDRNAVQYWANKFDCYHLVVWLHTNKDDYFKWLSGDFEAVEDEPEEEE